jgi:thiamine-monophosphate kinase
MVIRLGPGPEFDLIRRVLAAAPPAGPNVVVGPGDDCAVVAGHGIALTVDMAVEDVHFRRAWMEPREIGYHAAAAAISDLAAMAATPIGVLAALALGPGDETETGPGLMEGVRQAAAAAGAALLGGDVTRSPGPLVVDIVAAGEAPAPVLRSGARPGDGVWVTGRLGAAAAAVAAWLAGREPEPVARLAFVRPTPRTREALWLRERGVPSAMVDLSDGLAGDAGHIAAASGVALRLEADRIPIAPVLAGTPDALRFAVAGGQDYELCFTAPAGAGEAVAAAFEARFGLPMTRVGEVGEGEGVRIVDARGRPLELEAFQHWRRS